MDAQKRKSLVETLQQKGKMSKHKLSQETDIPYATLCLMVAELIGEGLIHEHRLTPTFTLLELV